MSSRLVAARAPTSLASSSASAAARRRRHAAATASSSTSAPSDVVGDRGVSSRRRALLAALALATAPVRPPRASAASAADALADARELYGAGGLEDAEAVLERAVAVADDRDLEASSKAALLKLLGDVRVDAYAYERAMRAYDAALEADPRGASASGAHFGRANALEGLAAAAATALYESAIDDYGACLELAKPDSAGPAVPLFERAQAYKRLERWDDARRDYAAAAVAFADARARKEQKIAEAQAAFATFETGDVAAARRQLETLSRQLYSSDVRAALVACYWVAGDAARAEDLWLSLCEMDASRCGNRRESEYADAGWLLERRKWTPGLAAGMGDFLALRPAAAAVE